MKRLLILLAALLALLLIASTVLVTTSTGLRLVSRVALPMVPGQVTFDTLAGRLIGPLTITQLVWQKDEQRLSIEHIDLDWHLAKLASRHLHIERFEASGVRWQAPASASSETEAGVFSLPGLPIVITAGMLHIEDILIEHGTLNTPVRSVRLAGRLDNEHYRLETLAVQSADFDLNGAAVIGVPAPHDIDTDLHWTARLKDQTTPVQGRTSAKGNADELAVQIHAGGPFDLTLTGTALSLLSDPRIDGKLDLQNFDPAITGTEMQTGLLSTAIEFAVAHDGIDLTGRVLAPELWPAAAIIEADIGLDSAVIELRQVKVQLENLKTAVAVSGTLQTDLSDLNLELGWTDLVWPPGDEPTFASSRGVANLTGSMDRYKLQLNGTTEKGLAPAASIALRGDGTKSQFNLVDVTVRFESTLR